MRPPLLAVLVIALLLAGCAAQPVLQERAPEDGPRSTRQSRGGGSSSSRSYEEADPAKNNTTLYFQKAPSMGLDAPWAAEPSREPLYGPFGSGVASSATNPEFRYKATTKGRYVGGGATIWFRVTDTTPTYGFGCDFSLNAYVFPPGQNPSGSPGSARTMYFDSGRCAIPQFPIEPGTYKVDFTASPFFSNQGGIAIERNATLVFRVTTSGFSNDVRPTVYMLAGSQAHPSNVFIEGWSERPPL